MIRAAKRLQLQPLPESHDDGSGGGPASFAAAAVAIEQATASDVVGGGMEFWLHSKIAARRHLSRAKTKPHSFRQPPRAGMSHWGMLPALVVTEATGIGGWPSRSRNQAPICPAGDGREPNGHRQEPSASS